MDEMKDKYLDYDGVKHLMGIIAKRDQEIINTLVSLINKINAQWNDLQPTNPTDE